MRIERVMLAVVACASLISCGPSAGGSSPPTAVASVAPPSGSDWLTTISETPDGGMRMGNPTAAIRLVEYGSLTCPHCAEFSRAAHEPLARKYIATGKVSFEFRNYVRDPVDVTASLLAQCNGPSAFFTIIDGLYADQAEWVGRAQALQPAEAAKLEALNPSEQVVHYARVTGLKDFVRQRGVSEARADACLNDAAAAQRLLSLQQQALAQFAIQATPTFVINGQKIDDVASWDAVELELKARGA